MTRSTPEAPVRFIQVGAGAMGEWWLRTLAVSAEAELVGLADLDVDRARLSAQRAGVDRVPVAATVEELLHLDADAVLNVTVPAAHHAVTTAALFAGRPVLTEKPFADTVAACLSMVAASELTGRLVMVSQSRRYWRALPPLRRMLTDIAPVGILSCQFFRAPPLGGFRATMAFPMLIEMAIHHFDLARLLTASEPVSVFCTSYNPSWSWLAGDAAGSVSFRFASGAVFTLDASLVSPGADTSWNGEWRISGGGGTAFWDGDHAPRAVTATGEPITGELGDEPEEIAGSLREFVQTMRHGGRPTGEAHTNVLSVAMVEAATRSAETGAPVSIAEVLEAAYAEAVRVEARDAVREVLLGWDSVHCVPHQ